MMQTTIEREDAVAHLVQAARGVAMILCALAAYAESDHVQAGEPEAFTILADRLYDAAFEVEDASLEVHAHE